MSFKDFPEQSQGVTLLQRSLERGRLGHAYLLTGDRIEELEAIARTLAKTLNCQKPVKSGGVAIDCCDECLSCRKIDHDNHADLHWLRPESKSRVIEIGQIVERPTSREIPLLNRIYLKPSEGEYKVAVIVAADRMNPQAANAFLKTLEEPPPKSVLILLSMEPARVLETIMSRCLRLNLGGEGVRKWDVALLEWLAKFVVVAGAEQKSLLGRYRLMDVLARRLAEMRALVEEEMTAESPLEKYDDVEKDLREKWEKELKAGIEAEYRRQRVEVLLALQWWLRDVWLHTLAAGRELLNFPMLVGAEQVAARITSRQAQDNLHVLEHTQWLLNSTQVQEALTLEVGLLKLNL